MFVSKKPMNMSENSSSNPWGQSGVMQKLGFVTNTSSGNSSSKIYSTMPVNDDTNYEEDSDDVDSDDLDSDSDESENITADGTRKMPTCFNDLFRRLDELTLDQINEPLRQWHCPACAGGPGAIDWYVGLQPLISHARTKGSKRVKLHRQLAQLLDEELRSRGTSVVPTGEAFGKWRGLAQMNDRDIVWPPVVCIMNTHMERDDNDKWTGMGNQELLELFSEYKPAKARHSYGPQGHRGMSVIIFENSAVGYLNAERLHNQFREQKFDREAWNRRPKLLFAGGIRQLYGYMADKHDLDIFNKHSKDDTKLKFELRSYLEMVVNQLEQMSEDNQSLNWFKNRLAQEQRHSKAVEGLLDISSEKLHKTSQENRIVKQRSKMHHEEMTEQMDSQEQFYMDQLEAILKARDAKEDNFEKIQQQEREKVKQRSSAKNVSATQGARSEEVAKFIRIQEEQMEEFVAERDRLIKVREDKMMEVENRYLDEKLNLEKEFDDELNQLMAKYTPTSSDTKH